MSASCLDLQTRAVVSAPLELESDRVEPRSPAAAAGAREPSSGHGHPLRHGGSGGLGTVLEEELAMLTAEEQRPELEVPGAGHNPDLLSLFRQKEKDLVLAAKLGKALLERNQDLSKQYEKMHKDLSEKLEVKLEQTQFLFTVSVEEEGAEQSYSIDRNIMEYSLAASLVGGSYFHQ